MGRRRSGKKRRSSQGDGGGTKTKSPTTSQPSSPAITSLARSPEPAWAESALEEAAKPVPEFPQREPQNLPEAGRDEDITEWTEAHINDTSGPLSSRDAHAVTDPDMDEETVVRLTETPESKRRSLKVSHSEKFFAKRVVVTSKPHREEQHERFNEAEDTTDHEQTKAEDRARCVDNRSDGQMKVKSTPRVGGISDKISLFESQASNPFKSNFTNARRGDISPAQNVSRQRQFTESTSSKSDSVPSNLSVKDRALNFSADRRIDMTFTLPSTTAGVSAQTWNGGQLKTAGHTETSLLTKTFDKSAAKAYTSGERPEVAPNPPLNTDQTDSKSHNATENASNDEIKEVSSPADRSEQIKSPTRTASRSKKRRSKEVAQPLSPTSKNKREVSQDKHELRDTERSSVPDMPSKHLTGTKTTDQYSDKLPTNSSRIPKEKPEDLLRAKTRTVAKCYKEMDEKVVSPTSETSQPSPASAYQTTISSNEDQTEPKHSEKEERRTNESSERESLKNRDTIVKPDPYVTNEEKPPAPEDLKEASHKYPFVPVNSSSGKDVVRNGKNKTDFKVLPEKDTATARETSVCVPKSDENKDNLTLKNNNTSKPEIKTKMIKLKNTSSISTRQSKRTETTENDISIKLTNESSENTFPPIQSNNENLSLSSANEKLTPSSQRASKFSTEQTDETTTKPTSTDETTSSLPTSAHKKTELPPASTEETSTPTPSITEKQTPASTEKKTTPPPESSIEKTTAQPTSSSDTTVTSSLGSSNKKTTSPTASSVEKITPLPILSEEKTTPPPESSNEKTTTPASTDKTATPPPALTVEKTTTPAAASTKKTTLPPKPTVEITTPPPAAEVKKTASPASSSNEKTMPPPASSEKKTTPPPASTVEKTTPPLTSSEKKTTAPPTSSEKKTTPPPASSNEKTTPPAASNVEKTTPPVASSNEKTTPPAASSNEKTTPPTAIILEKTTPQVASSNEKTTPPAASSNLKTTPPAAASNEMTTPPPSSTEKKTTPPATLTVEITTPPPASTVEKTTPPAASSNEQTTSLLSSTVGKTTRTASSSEKKNTTTEASTSASTEKKSTPPTVLSDEKTTPPQKSLSPVNVMNAQSSGPATRKKEFLRKPMFLPQIPSSPGRDSLNRDSLSSWLDVERPVRKKQLTPDPKPKLSSSSSESSLLEASRDFDPNDFISKVKRQAMPFTLPQRRHKKHRLHTPSFAMPPIREDRNEKAFDVEEFQHGLRRRREFTLDLIPSKTSEEDKSKRVNPERESILTRSVLFRRAKTEETEEEKENDSDESKPEAGKVRSRLERCSILSSLSHPTKTRRKDFLSLTESPTDVLLSTSDAPESPSTTVESPKPDTSCTQTDHRINLKPTDPTPNLKLSSADPILTIATKPPISLQTGFQLNLQSDNYGPAITPDPRMTSADAAITIATKPPPPSSVPACSQLNLQSDNSGPAITHDPRMTTVDGAVTIATKPPPPTSLPTGFQLNLQSDNNGPAVTPDPRMTSADAAINIATRPPPPGMQAGFQVNLQPAVQPEPTVPMGTEDSPPPFPSFDDIRFPGYLEKILPKGPEASVSRESLSGPVGLNKAVDVQTSDNSVPVAPPADIPVAPGFHRRPGKIVVYQQHQFSGQSFDFYRDEEDVTHLQLSSVISLKVHRGCWILYEKAGFVGRCIALEEEEIVEFANQWGEEAGQTSVPFVIGSLRLAIRDYTPPRIELFSEADGRGRSSEFVDDTNELGAFGLPQNTGSIKVHSGLWQVFSDAEFQGLMAVLESGEYPCPESWGFSVPAVGSLRALRMGSVKVQHPNAVKAALYEKAGLQGGCVEVQGDVFSFRGTDGEPEGHGLSSVASLKILRGLWVGYDEDGFEGQQFVLEEGEYLDWRDWGGMGQNLLSLRPVLTDFLSPHMKMFRDLDFFERAGNVDVMELLENTANTEYGPQTQSIDVLSGAWIVFDEPQFCGRHYVLEKGLYSSPEDWGSSNSKILSVIPIMLENLNSSHFKIQMFSEPEFSGTSVLVEDTLPTMPQGFIMSSCRVHAGSWLAFGCESFSGSQCVLEDGDYPDLRMMGFTQPKTSVLSLQPVGHEFSLPSIVLFERSGFRGRRLVLKSSSVNLQLTESCTRVSSILVEGGIWVLYESNNFRGSQFLLRPGEVPDWQRISTWSRIGSLRPLIQKQAHFRLRNKEAGLMMSLVGSLGEMMRIQATEEMGGVEQVWMYQDGHLQSKLLAGCFVDASSSMLMAGTRAVPSSDPDKPHQLWNINSDGLIRNNAAPNLVLEVKGGQQFDRNQIIINEFHPNKLNQRWSLELL